MNYSQIGFSNDESLGSEETQLIRSSLRESEEELHQLLVQSAGISRRIAATQEKILRYKIALATHKKVPEDIFRLIFILVCSGSEIHLPPRRRIPSPQITLTHVCSGWRKLAFSIPELWNDIILSPFRLGRISKAVLPEWFCRAPHARVRTELGLHFASHFNHGFPGFLASCPFKQLKIVIGRASLGYINKIPGESVKYLKELEINAIGDILDHLLLEDKPHAFPFLTTARFPHLTILRLHTIWGQKITGISLPSQIQYVDMSGCMIQVSDCLRVLRDCPAIEQFYIGQALDWPFEPSFNGDVTASNLINLQINFFQQEAVNRLLPKLRAPQLKQLLLAPDDGIPLTIPWSKTMTSILVLQYALEQLEDLEIGRTTDPVDMKSLLSSTNALRRLTVENPFFGPDALAGLATGQLAPRLVSLVAKRPLDSSALLGMVERRLENACKSRDGPSQFEPLRRVMFAANPDSEEPQRERLTLLAKQGVQVRTMHWGL